MLKILLVLCEFSFLIISVLVVGESYVIKNENTKFGKWWRKNICAPDPEENG